MLLVAWLLASAAAVAQEPLTLSDAIARALANHPARKVAVAERDTGAAEFREARSGLLPNFSLSESFTRGDDPVYVFGTKLRQQRFTAGDFDLLQLNTPGPVNNWATRLGGSWRVFDTFMSWHAVRRAGHMRDAAARQLERAEQEVVFAAVDAYFGVLLAQRQLEVAQSSLKTAESLRQRSADRVQAGIAVEADRLSAEVNLASRKQAVTVADHGVKLARARLALAICAGAATEFTLADVQPEATPLSGGLEPLEAAALERRPDLLRMRAQEEAAISGVKAARSAFGPRVNVFGHFETDSRTFAGGDGTNYVGGVELQLDLFQGGAKAAQLARARALRERLAAARQMAEDGVRLELRRAWFDHQAARQMLEVMRGAMQQAEESLRITQNRYESGLNTITDLLRVEEALRQTQSDYWGAAYRVRISAAALELATGTLDQNSPAVSQ